MESFALYLLKSFIWLSGFALVFFLFLRNERFFLLNRIYLIAGILTSFIFPFISVHYSVVLPLIPAIHTDVTVLKEVQQIAPEKIPVMYLLLFGLYLSGALTVIFIFIKQSKHLIKVIKKAEIITAHPVKLIRTAEYSTSFSFFSYVFVNPSITDVETKEIVNHEMVHIRQRHWFDLMLVELLCMFQWFNPLVWIYIRFIRQNHEYLADEVALQRTSDPAIYRAALLNQIVGSPVVSLTNSFNYSLNKKRFNMMKNIISSPYRKMKIFLIIPVFAIVLYAFATPDYRYISVDDNSGNNSFVSDALIKGVKGNVVEQKGNPLKGAAVVVSGTTMGVTSDAKGYFSLDNVPEEASLVVSYVGYKTKVIKPVFTSEMIIRMEKDTVNLKRIDVPPPPPPPPPSASTITRLGSDIGTKPLIVVNGVVRDIESNDIDPNTIESITVLKDQSATLLYGEKGKNGVILIRLKPGIVDLNKPIVTNKDKLEVTGYGNNSSRSTGIIIKNSSDGTISKALVIIDGTISTNGTDDINPNDIESISVRKDQSAVEKYGEKGKDGVIEITTKKGNYGGMNMLSEVKVNGDDNNQNNADKKVILTEEMPVFPGGEKAIKSWIYSNIKVMKGAEKISRPIYVVFTVDSKGKVRDAQVLKKEYPVWEAEAVRVVSSMPEWKPGSQNGNPIDVILQLPIDFTPGYK